MASRPDAVYTFPNDDGLTLLAALPIHDRLPTWKSDLERNFIRVFENLPDGPAVDPSKRVSEIMGILEMPNVSRPPASPGLALIGDAALAADPLWGVGCGWAFQTAEWLVDRTCDSLRAGRGLDDALDQYRRSHRRKLAGHEFLISDFSSGRNFNPLEKLMFSSAARNPACAAHVAAFGTRSMLSLSFSHRVRSLERLKSICHIDCTIDQVGRGRRPHHHDRRKFYSRSHLGHSWL